jgi:succinoglycan biosynthesis transport protein ExoP
VYEEEVDLQELWQALMKRKWLIIGITVVAMVVAYVASCMMTPIYEAEATFIVQGGASGLALPFSVLGDVTGIEGKSSALNYAEILKSRTVLERSVAQLGLEPEVNAPSIKDLRDAINVQSIAKTDVISLKVQLADRSMACDLANKLVQVLIEQNRIMNQAASRTAREYLATQVDESSLKLLEAEERLLAVKAGEKIIAPTAETEALLKRLVEMGLQQATIDITVDQMRARADKVREQLAEMAETVVSSESVIEDPVVQGHRARLADLELQLAVAREKYTEKHPEVQRLAGEIDEVKKSLSSAVAKVVGTQVSSRNPMREALIIEVAEAEAQITAARAQQEAMGKLIAQEEKKLNELPAKELSLARVMRECELAQQVYIMLRTRYEEVRLTEQIQVSDIFPLDVAIEPEKPVKPRKMLNTAIAGILGIFVGVGAAFVMENADTSMASVEDVEKATGLPTLGTIPVHIGALAEGVAPYSGGQHRSLS